jgi:hypothetical protein
MKFNAYPQTVWSLPATPNRVSIIWCPLYALSASLSLALCLFSFTSRAQSDTARFQHQLEIGTIATTNQTPFLLRIGQFGTVPRTGAVSMRFSSVGKLTKPAARVAVDYGLELVGLAKTTPELLLSQGYLRVGGRWWEIWAGRRKQFYDIGDTLLSSGSYTFSTNSLPLPRIQLGTPGFVTLPFTKDLVAFNALFAHGWLGEQDTVKGAFVHHKSLYVRVGKPKFRAYFGITHAVQWGGELKYFRDNPSLSNKGKFASSFNIFLPYVFLPGNPGKDGGLAGIDNANALGNHLGTVNMALEGGGSKWNWLLYLQRPYEDKSGFAQQNWPDGLYGLRLVNRQGSKHGLRFQQLTLEYLYTLSQSGPLEDFQSTTQYGGRDDYFNHAQYKDSWIYRNNTIGTPFLSPLKDIQPKRKQRYELGQQWAIANNRVQAFYLAATGNINQHQIDLRYSLSYNHGLYRGPFPTNLWQYSGMVRVNWQVDKVENLQITTALALDGDGIFRSSFGGWVSLRKTWGHQR